MSFASLWESLLPIGRNPGTGGYRRFSWTEADLACRAWFLAAAAERGLAVTPDGNGNLWAWWDRPAGGRDGAVVTGSHLDSVPEGGAFDGPLGVVSAFAAIDLLRERGRVPARPIAVAAFTEEEGARFGVACLGSKLLTGLLAPGTALALRDSDGVSLADAMTAAGHDPALAGPDDELVASIAAFVELHVEQGRALATLGGAQPAGTAGGAQPGSPAPGRARPGGAVIGVAEGIWPHGRWRFGFTGRADHAGTARLPDRHDPMLPYATTVLAARECAARLGTLATFGKVIAEPGGVNAVSSSVRAWLDARAPDQDGLALTVDEIREAAALAATEHGIELAVAVESVTPPVGFDAALRARIEAALAAAGFDAPMLPTGAGHDAGVLAARVPTAMLFVRNPDGVSHAPAEHAELADCELGVIALAAVLEDLAC